MDKLEEEQPSGPGNTGLGPCPRIRPSLDRQWTRKMNIIIKFFKAEEETFCKTTYYRIKSVQWMTGMRKVKPLEQVRIWLYAWIQQKL